MKLQHKEPSPQKQESKPVVSYNRSAYEENPQAILVYGKHKNKNLQWVKDHDKNYYQWLKEQDLISKWNLERIKDIQIKTTKPKWDPFRASTGEIWMGIKVIPTE